jgi:hypothetical protein
MFRSQQPLIRRGRCGSQTRAPTANFGMHRSRFIHGRSGVNSFLSADAFRSRGMHGPRSGFRNFVELRSSKIELVNHTFVANEVDFSALIGAERGDVLG